jgi:hypothetical protein
MCTVNAGTESTNGIEESKTATEDFYVDFQELPNGIPSHGTSNRVFLAFAPV